MSSAKISSPRPLRLYSCPGENRDFAWGHAMTYKTFIAAIAVVVAVAVQPVAAAEAPTADVVRKSAKRALPYLEREGIAWMKTRMCMTCHQIPSMAWSFNVAREHGVPVDAAKVALWNQWCVDNGLKRSVYYKLLDTSFATLKESGLSDDDLSKLQPLKDKNFVFEAEFLEEVGKQLPVERVASHQAAILTSAAKGGNGGSGTGENNQYTAMLLSGAPAVVAGADDVRKELVAGLVKRQNQDGSWPSSGQFLAQQRPKEETLEVVTRWTVLALSDVPNLSPEGVAAAAKAREWLKGAGDIVSVEALLLRAMQAHKDGDEKTAVSLRDEILKLQHDDGGWGWLRERPASDPFTTGLILYGLSYLGRDSADPAVQKAWQYLLNTQDETGEWKLSVKTISASNKADTKNGDAIYTYWATAWAVIGLLETLPK